MNETVMAYIIIALLSVIAGVLGTNLYSNRKSTEDLRERISNGIPDSRELDGSKQRFENTVGEIRKNRQDKE